MREASEDTCEKERKWNSEDSKILIVSGIYWAISMVGGYTVLSLRACELDSMSLFDLWASRNLDRLNNWPQIIVKPFSPLPTLPWETCSNVGGRSSYPTHGNKCDEEAVLGHCFSCRISPLRYTQPSLTWNNYFLRLRTALEHDCRRKRAGRTCLEDIILLTVMRKVSGRVLWPVPETW